MRGVERAPGRREHDVDLPELGYLLTTAAHIPVLPYDGPTNTLEQLKDLVGRHRTVEDALAVPYAHLQSITMEEKNETNKESLIIARQ